MEMELLKKLEAAGFEPTAMNGRDAWQKSEPGNPLLVAIREESGPSWFVDLFDTRHATRRIHSHQAGSLDGALSFVESLGEFE
jgi:hypothetical protein